MGSDFLVVGGGIAGASAGYFLAALGSVTLLEMEQAPGYHSTGRSAALFSEYYGNGVVRALTAASRRFYTDPPPGFGRPLLTPRGVLTLCPHGAEEEFSEVLAAGQSAPVPAREIGLEQAPGYCPVVRPGWFSRAMVKPAVMDIDSGALHQGFLRGIRACGGTVLSSSRVTGLSRRNGTWRAVTGSGEFSAATVVNASGAWADEVARLAGVAPAGLTPLRRTAFIISAPDPVPGWRPVADWPLLADVTDTFYVKPESGALLISPCDATPVPPGDARPDDLDVARAAARVEEATTLTIRHVRHAWAGLRTAAPDDTPVVGQAPGEPGFFWAAGLSGYGLQSAPAVGQLAAALAAGQAPLVDGAEPAFDLACLAPARLAAGPPAAGQPALGPPAPGQPAPARAAQAGREPERITAGQAG